MLKKQYHIYGYWWTLQRAPEPNSNTLKVEALISFETSEQTFHPYKVQEPKRLATENPKAQR